jgi:hypothetical protein
MKGTYTAAEDPPNLRCWNQKRRYGADFLYPFERYVAGFTETKLLSRRGQVVQNPLYDDLSAACNKATGAGCVGERDASLVFVAGIVGVPWQDIAVDPTDLTKGYLTATQLTDMNVWAKIVGVPNDQQNAYAPPIAPNDPHMLESIVPRPGLPPPSSAPDADPINGHEWDPSQVAPPNADLQYACTFPLPATKTCTEGIDCDCFVPPGGNAAAAANPLCQNGGMYSNVQTRAKAYPGIRELQVLEGLGDQAIVASICPANVTNMNAADYGYRPAVGALINRLRSPLRTRCLPRQLVVKPGGEVPCVIFEAFDPPPGASCDCGGPARSFVASDSPRITAEVRRQGTCFCEIAQLIDAKDSQHPAAGTICRTNVSPPADEPSGWCYVDPAQAGANAAGQCQIVSTCPPTDRRIIRFVDTASEPRNGATGLLVCDDPGAPGGPATDPCP